MPPPLSDPAQRQLLAIADAGGAIEVGVRPQTKVSRGVHLRDDLLWDETAWCSDLPVRRQVVEALVRRGLLAVEIAARFAADGGYLWCTPPHLVGKPCRLRITLTERGAETVEVLRRLAAVEEESQRQAVEEAVATSGGRVVKL